MELLNLPLRKERESLIGTFLTGTDGSPENSTQIRTTHGFVPKSSASGRRVFKQLVRIWSSNRVHTLEMKARILYWLGP